MPDVTASLSMSWSIKNGLTKEYTFLTNQGKESWLPNYQASRTNCIRTFRSNFIQKSLNFYNRGVLLRAHSTAYQTADSISRKWGRNDRKIHNLVFVVLFDESLLRIFSTDWQLSKIRKSLQEAWAKYTTNVWAI